MMLSVFSWAAFVEASDIVGEREATLNSAFFVRTTCGKDSSGMLQFSVKHLTVNHVTDYDQGR